MHYLLRMAWSDLIHSFVVRRLISIFGSKTYQDLGYSPGWWLLHSHTVALQAWEGQIT